MVFRTITVQERPRLTDSTNELHFSPPPGEEVLPSVWLDLHVAGDGYQKCGDDRLRRFSSKSNGRPFVRIKPHQAIRVFTAEAIGVDCRHLAIVTNVASKAKHGLIVAPGKIDPGFGRHKLILVIYNQADRAIDLYSGDKIACLAFAKISEAARATESLGHANPSFPDYAPSRIDRLKDWYLLQVQPNWGSSLLQTLVRLVAYAVAAAAGAYWATHGGNIP